jgi:hypothetical protein
MREGQPPVQLVVKIAGLDTSLVSVVATRLAVGPAALDYGEKGPTPA